MICSSEELVKQIIPIYTRKNPHPVKRKADCPIEVSYKQGLRQSMLQELKTCKDREVVIEKYKRKVEQL